jgi:hypothetical protein
VKVLLHICCAPCTVYPLRTLRAEGADVTGFFHNPNIHPYTEFKKRQEALAQYSRVALLPLITDDAYDIDAFLRAALAAGQDRCLACYRMRLTAAFGKAAALEADAVTTTLLYSIYQRHEAVAQIAGELSDRYGLPFLYRDFRPGWREGQDEAVRLGVYRQAYCGCIFSEYERFGPNAKGSGKAADKTVDKAAGGSRKR